MKRRFQRSPLAWMEGVVRLFDGLGPDSGQRTRRATQSLSEQTVTKLEAKHEPLR
jgi:hypothetical protein